MFCLLGVCRPVTNVTDPKKECGSAKIKTRVSGPVFGQEIIVCLEIVSLKQYQRTLFHYNIQFPCAC